MSDAPSARISSRRTQWPIFIALCIEKSRPKPFSGLMRLMSGASLSGT